MRNFAERLIGEETRGNQTSGKNTPAIFLVCEKLRQHLATFMGKTGFRAVLSRALALANAEAPALRAVQVNAEGSLEGVTELDPRKIAEVSVVLLAQLLGLLTAFIGVNLTLGLLSEVWPKLSLDELSFEDGDKK
jgi:hypothetical protein